MAVLILCFVSVLSFALPSDSSADLNVVLGGQRVLAEYRLEPQKSWEASAPAKKDPGKLVATSFHLYPNSPLYSAERPVGAGWVVWHRNRLGVQAMYFQLVADENLRRGGVPEKMEWADLNHDGLSDLKITWAAGKIETYVNRNKHDKLFSGNFSFSP